jgi:alpha/beta superfamily hydrolase
VSALRLQRPDGVDLQGWKAVPKSRQKPEKVLIYFGGRMEDAWWAPKMASYLDGWAVYAFNYRGFGESKGASSERNAKADALAIHQWVRQNHPQKDTEIALMGRSLGTAIAIWLAHAVNPCKLVLVSPFCSVRSVLLARFWLAPLAMLAGKRFLNARLAPDIATQTLIVLAEKDQQIAHADSLRLARKFATQPVVLKIMGTNHKTVPRNEATQRAVAGFLMERQ